MRGIPFAWERRDVEEFVKDSGIQAEKVSLPPSDRRQSTHPSLLAVACLLATQELAMLTSVFPCSFCSSAWQARPATVATRE